MTIYDQRTAMLEEIRVLELANILAGPLVGQFCAELGAEVIKVEQPGSGDPTRGWRLAEESSDADYTAYFSCANWGKLSIALDASVAEGRQVVHDLAARADVVIMGYKPGDDVKFGFDYETLRGINPGLIYLQITAYGENDDRPGFDAIIQAESGFTYLNGEADGPPVKMPVALVDVLAAHQLKEGLLLALLKRERTGVGSLISTSLLGTAVASLANQATNYLVAGVEPQRIGSEHPNIAPYGTIFVTNDGREFVLAVGTERQYRDFIEALDMQELEADHRFSENSSRVVNRNALNQLIKAHVEKLDSADLAERLEAYKVPFGFVNRMMAAFAQPESQRQLLEGGTGVRTLALGGDIEGMTKLKAPPALNADGRKILESIGYDAERITEIEISGAWKK